ncbi:MAG TPA: hypothetical protein VGO85_13080 [Caldimonas sp.]|jgi:uncharacterized membrane protein|nr:hypothetical protein [Caldimonas sp.]
MQPDSFLGLSWRQWALVALALSVVVVLVHKAVVRARQRERTEQLARAADAAHEGALTRHEGGA